MEPRNVFIELLPFALVPGCGQCAFNTGINCSVQVEIWLSATCSGICKLGVEPSRAKVLDTRKNDEHLKCQSVFDRPSVSVMLTVSPRERWQHTNKELAESINSSIQLSRKIQ